MNKIIFVISTLLLTGTFTHAQEGCDSTQTGRTQVCSIGSAVTESGNAAIESGDLMIVERVTQQDTTTSTTCMTVSDVHIAYVTLKGTLRLPGTNSFTAAKGTGAASTENHSLSFNRATSNYEISHLTFDRNSGLVIEAALIKIPTMKNSTQILPVTVNGEDMDLPIQCHY